MSSVQWSNEVRLWSSKASSSALPHTVVVLEGLEEKSSPTSPSKSSCCCCCCGNSMQSLTDRPRKEAG